MVSSLRNPMQRYCKLRTQGLLLLCRLIKAGALHKRHAPRITLISAWSEFLGYVCSITVKVLQVQDCRAAEQTMAHELSQHKVISAELLQLWAFAAG